MARHYSTRDFFRQMPNALLARYFKQRELFDNIDFAAMKETKPDALFAAWLEHATTSEPRDPTAMTLATVDADGVVEDVKLLRADHEGFGIPQAVMDAVKQYRFKPATKDGVKVKTFVTVTKPYRFVTR